VTVNRVWIESEPDKPISVGQLYFCGSYSPCMVIKVVFPDLEKEYFGITSFETGWVSLLCESLGELEDVLLEDGYTQVKTNVWIAPGG